MDVTNFTSDGATIRIGRYGKVGSGNVTVGLLGLNSPVGHASRMIERAVARDPGEYVEITCPGFDPLAPLAVPAAEIVDRVVELVEAAVLWVLDGRPAARVWGHSMGALTARNLIARRNVNVGRACLFTPAYRVTRLTEAAAGQRAGDIGHRLIDALPAAVSWQLARIGVSTLSYGLPFMHGDEVALVVDPLRDGCGPRLDRDAARTMLTNTRRVVAGLIGRGGADALRETHGVPITHVWGRLDVLVRPACPGRRVWTGHDVITQRPEDAARLLLADR
jgi:pimeloyl-ACP methyl ester carboxylesterase